MSRGDSRRAIELFESAIAIRPGHAQSHYKLANALNVTGQWDRALAGYARAIDLDPGHSFAYCNRGTVLERLFRWDEALSSYERAIALAPGDFLAHFDRASVLRKLRRLPEALSSYERAITLKTDYVDARINMAHVLDELDLPAEAVASYKLAIDLRPDCVEALLGRGQALESLKRFPEAIADFDRLCMIDPAQKYLLGLRCFARAQICDWSSFEDDLAALADGISDMRPVCMPFPALALFDSPEVHRRAAEVWVREECAPDDSLGPICARSREHIIRLGYFSADFREHPVARLTVGLFECHDRSRFEITGFAFGPTSNDEMTQRLTRAFDHFIDVRGMSDREVASLARRMKIDIAIDLGGFTKYSRPRIFALRAAPLQLGYVGYLGTMGAPYMDYVVADEVLMPPESRCRYSEKVLTLSTYQVNDSTRERPTRIFTRAELGLPASGFVYSCFNANYKISPEVFSSWMRILRRIENSCLLLSVDSGDAERNLRNAATRLGISADRIVFGARMTFSDYLARYSAVDLFLDTLPYNAGATASDALWSGVPVLTCLGQGFAGRYAASLLAALGMTELIAETRQQYEEIAVSLAEDVGRMAATKSRLADSLLSSTLFDTQRFARDIESAFAQIYERHHLGLPPDHLSVHENDAQVARVVI